MNIQEIRQKIEAAVKNHLDNGGQLVTCQFGVIFSRTEKKWVFGQNRFLTSQQPICCAIGCVAVYGNPETNGSDTIYELASKELGMAIHEVSEFTRGFDNGFPPEKNASEIEWLGYQLRQKYVAMGEL